MDNIRIIFVLPEKYNEESEVSQIMLEAYEVSKYLILYSINIYRLSIAM